MVIFEQRSAAYSCLSEHRSTKNYHLQTTIGGLCNTSIETVKRECYGLS